MHNLDIKNIDPKDAWKILQDEKDSVLIDVRTNPEWGFVGGVDLSQIGKQIMFLSWRIYPNMAQNEDFYEQLSREIANKDAKLLFLCRSGQRSLDAAIECNKRGYANCYNITGGFEGDVDINGHRGNVNGWKNANLPWRQN